jgi:type IV secretion system protein VirB6
MSGIPSYSTIVLRLSNQIDLILKSFVYNGYQAVADHLRYPLGLAVTLYIIILGISISQGWVKLSFGNFTKSCLKIGLIYSLGMHWSTFSFYIVKGIEGSAGQIGDWLINATPITIPHFAGEGINGGLQSVLIEVTKVGLWTWHRGKLYNYTPFFTAVVIWAFGYAALMLAVIEILMAKMMIAILFTVAPLFVAFTVFKATHGFFDKWLGVICGFVFFLILIPAGVALMLNCLQWTLVGEYANHSQGLNVVGFVPVVMVSVLSVLLILKITAYAHVIGGSVATSAGSALVAGFIGGSIGAGVAGVRHGRAAVSSTLGAAGKLAKVGDRATGRVASRAMGALKQRLQSGK